MQILGFTLLALKHVLTDKYVLRFYICSHKCWWDEKCLQKNLGS